MSGKYKRLGHNQEPKTLPVVKPDGVKNFLAETDLSIGSVVRVSMDCFRKNLEDVVSSWSSGFVTANYKPDQTVLSGEVFALLKKYPNENYSTLKIYTGRPDGWSEFTNNVSAFTQMDLNVVAFKIDDDLNVRGDAIALDHQKPQAPFNPDCRSPDVSSNNILSSLDYDKPAPFVSMEPLSAFEEFDKYIDTRLQPILCKFNIV